MNRRAQFSVLAWVWLVGLVAVLVFANHALTGAGRMQAPARFDVRLPFASQLAVAGGDRYLAANVAVFRALMVRTEEMDTEDYALLARIHDDASLLNPAHEDNYYIAAAILPWNGQLEGTQTVLARAMEARTQDHLPAFFYAFHQKHFMQQPVAAAETLRRAAARIHDQALRIQMEALAVRWYERGNLAEAARIQRMMAEQTRNPGFRAYLLKRARRVELLEGLQSAVAAYRRKFSHPPRSFNQLYSSGLIAGLPEDPLGGKFLLSPDGKVSVQDPK